MLSVELAWPGGKAATVADALAHYVSPECVKFKCPDDACPERSIHVGARVAFIAPLPPVLILHLKRFLLNEKNNSTVFLSLTVEMPGHPDTHFKLYAVTCHLGASLHGGHYVTFFRKMNTTGEERWFLADDATVKVVSADTVLGMTKCVRKGKPSFNSRKTAYLLFYEQQQGGYKPEAEPIPKSSTHETEAVQYSTHKGTSAFNEMQAIVEQAQQNAHRAGRKTRSRK